MSLLLLTIASIHVFCQQVYPMYWASEGSTTFGEFVIETNSQKIFQDFSEREFTVAKKKVWLRLPELERVWSH